MFKSGLSSKYISATLCYYVFLQIAPSLIKCRCAATCPKYISVSQQHKRGKKWATQAISTCSWIRMRTIQFRWKDIMELLTPKIVAECAKYGRAGQRYDVIFLFHCIFCWIILYFRHAPGSKYLFWESKTKSSSPPHALYISLWCFPLPDQQQQQKKPTVGLQQIADQKIHGVIVIKLSLMYFLFPVLDHPGP